jgi:Arc/MetJ-type ribon-helix-helix transcriptional regulator
MSHRLQVLIPETLDAAISKAAQRRRFSKGEWVRRALELALERERQVGDPLERLGALEAPTADIDQMLDEIQAGRWR